MFTVMHNHGCQIECIWNQIKTQIGRQPCERFLASDYLKHKVPPCSYLMPSGDRSDEKLWEK